MAVFDGLDGYTSKTVTYKSTPDGDVLVDVVYPVDADTSDATVLLHYHGGFLVFGDRYSFPPHWLVNASVARKWIFVTPDYRLIPETNAQSSVQDAVDAYKWVLSSLPDLLGRKIGKVLVAGSSAGGYLALSTAAAVEEQPSALLLIYGMLDATFSRYTTPGTNIFGLPAFDTSSLLKEFPIPTENDGRKVLTGYPLAGAGDDPRRSLVSAVHLEALYLDYMTGVEGLGAAIAKQGTAAIPEKHRNLFPLAFGNLAKLPPTLLLHGRNDSAVPAEPSLQAAEKLKAAGVKVYSEFPDDAEHGFDARAGNINVESSEADGVVAVQSLRNAVRFLNDAAQ